MEPGLGVKLSRRECVEVVGAGLLITVEARREATMPGHSLKNQRGTDALRAERGCGIIAGAFADRNVARVLYVKR